jgi:glycosyltransferase involved in cell wall biosynthesis
MPEDTRPLIVGTPHIHYASARNIIDLPFPNARVVRANNAFRIPNYLWFRTMGYIHPHLLNLHFDGGIGEYRVLHLFQGIHIGNRPWFSTFETYLPRWHDVGEKNLHWGFKQLAKKTCKGMFALSGCAENMQIQLFESYPYMRDEILPKIKVVHPSQVPLITRYEDKVLDPDAITMVMVGADFFRKGGLEVLRVMDRLLQEDAPLKLIIVSSLKAGDYASKTGPAEVAAAETLIAKHPGRIIHHRSLSNEAVLDLFRNAHIGLLPTWADTYGYSVLEAQAAGCPVITTNVRAMPEINHQGCGWMIPVEKDPLGNALIFSPEQRAVFAKRLEESLEEVFRQILADPGQIRPKGEAALARILSDHSPVKTAIWLEAEYRRALT